MQPAGYLVAAAAELAAGVQHRQAHLHGGAAHLGVNAHGEAAAVVPDGDAAILVQRHVDALAEARQRLVHGVVHNLIDQVMQAPHVRGADIHARALADGLQALQHLNLLLAVVMGHLGRLFNFILKHFVCHAAPHPSLVSSRADGAVSGAWETAEKNRSKRIYYITFGGKRKAFSFIINVVFGADASGLSGRMKFAGILQARRWKMHIAPGREREKYQRAPCIFRGIKV